MQLDNKPSAITHGKLHCTSADAGGGYGDQLKRSDMYVYMYILRERDKREWRMRCAPPCVTLSVLIVTRRIISTDRAIRLFARVFVAVKSLSVRARAIS